MSRKALRPVHLVLGALLLVTIVTYVGMGSGVSAQTYVLGQNRLLQAPVQPPVSISADQLLGTWEWAQRGRTEFQGEFELTEGPNGTIEGTIDDIMEGTYGDLIQGFEFEHNKFSLTRNGRFGLQEWTGIVSQTPDGFRLEGSFIKRGSTANDWRGPWPLVAEIKK